MENFFKKEETKGFVERGRPHYLIIVIIGNEGGGGMENDL